MKDYLVGIDIGTHETRVIITQEPADSSLPPRIISIGKARTEGMRHGYVVNVDAAAANLKEAIDQASQGGKYPITDAYISMNGASLRSDVYSLSLPVSNADGKVTETDLERIKSKAHDMLMKQRKNITVLHGAPLQFILDGEHVLGDPVGMSGSKLEMQMIFVTCLDNHKHILKEVAHEAGIADILDVIAAPLALGAVTLPERHKTVGALLLTIGSETTSMAVFEENKLIDLRVFQIGSYDITNDLALGFKVDLDTAESIKLDASYDVPKRRREEIIHARLNDIFEVVNDRLKHINRQALLPAGVMITGGGAHIDDITDLVQDALDMPTTKLTPKHIENITRKKIKDESILTAYGLCVLAYREYKNTDVSINLKGIFSSVKKSITTLVNQFLP